ncbi:tryptophan synthase beta subunit-like PLP-dependent enzyme [Ochromonadaceae sp. CCMP2298]|nr:tryptophan synthase beta subunit-like PLP-dependent enzyme [Ochromonadaceae sp. CCMP2298]
MAALVDLSLPTFEDVEQAAKRLAGAAHRTPALTSSTFDLRVGASVFFKAENLQRTGAFKFRGAYNAISCLSAEQRKAGVVTFSSGNHAQAIALSGTLLGVSTTIIMPEDAPAAKRTATEGYGASVVSYNRYTEDREAIAREIQQTRGCALIPPYNHPHVIAGQGTAALELFQDVIGVEPEAGNDGQQSFRSGNIVKIETPVTIADGAQTLALGELTFAVIREKVSDVLTVTDEQLAETMRFFAQTMKQVVEPTGCLAAAAIRHGVLKVPPGSRVGVIISGGNVDLAALAGFLCA